MVPVCAADHPLANAAPPIDHHTLEQQVQLVLTDRTPVSAHLRGGIVSLRIWRFADLATRLEYLLAGFGWCNMPLHLVEDHIRDGRLKQLVLKDRANIALPMHVAYERGRPPGRAGRWFVEDMRKRLRA
jgi:DNA-binding transcriptional LysR family regulator